MITLVVTSCGRFDLLERTLDSFFEYADMEIEHVVITEDSGDNFPLYFLDRHPNTSVINPPERVGQIRSIDRAYSLVTTPYVFHLEDDWEFFRTGFMRESLRRLIDPYCINHWLRDRTDTNGHPLDGDRLRPGYNGRWHGFTFNPTLKRMSDYHALGSYGKICAWDSDDPGKAEAAIGTHYNKMIYYASIAEQGYVKHIGEGRHVQ